MNSLRIRTRASNQLVGKIYYQGQMVPYLLRGGKIVYSEKPIQLPDVVMRIVVDDEASWMEIGFLSAAELIGNPTDGWVDPGHYVGIFAQNSVDLAEWKDGSFIESPTGAVVDNGDGTFWYWCRSTLPQFWKTQVGDNVASSNRYGKSITAIKLGGVLVSLPRYPYTMPSQAAILQADLRAAGYTAATVTSSTAALSVGIINHYYANGLAGRDELIPVMNGSNQVTSVSYLGAAISLPSYPYQMPAAQATLAADLGAAGYTGAVVKLYGDSWEVTIPDRIATSLNSRAFALTISPWDQYPWWNMQGVYQGLNPDDQVNGTYENIHTAGGAILVESERQFARLWIVAGDRYSTP